MSDYGLKSGDGGLANPFSSPDGGGYVYNSVVNPFADMVDQVLFFFFFASPRINPGAYR